MKYILDSGMGTELEAREINIPDWKINMDSQCSYFQPWIQSKIFI